jgi:hypothetical protein
MSTLRDLVAGEADRISSASGSKAPSGMNASIIGMLRYRHKHHRG